ncbi:eCIS core domain-containing protein [Niastella populi]|uniref:eCIS core domain-containing protein n=1 Tax=Niastella populi TaxID=550983 RepID=A0A1V9GCJ4_9BACT|nr:DUF4157 domain-containing protein [Niastella populi]OQP68333.1 hypothetical protein A4R26_00555 [Niastella populi]
MKTHATKTTAPAAATGSAPFFSKGGGQAMQNRETGGSFFNTGQTPAIQTKTAGDKHEQEAEGTADQVVQRSGETPAPVGETSGAPAIQADWMLGDLWPSEEPPTDGQCHVILGGRRIDHWSGYVPAMRHLYIDYYLNSSDYGVIEAGPVPSHATTGGGHSGAWVKPGTWEARGVQWDITPTDCPAFINCLKTRTAAYHAAGHPYHATSGPNSNSFAWWVLNQCGINVNFLLGPYPYLGYNYWQTHTAATRTPAPAGTPVPAPVPAEVQPKLTVGQPNDKYEQEADSVADHVVQRMSGTGNIQTKPVSGITPFTPGLQTKCPACEKEEAVQKKGSDGTAPANIEQQLSSSRGKGAPLPPQVRSKMENGIGSDLSKVRVHTGGDAVQMNRQLHAQAFTHGNDIYFNSGKYNTDSAAGQHLLAHELTHTVQQSGNASAPVQQKPEGVPNIQRVAFLAPLAGIGARYVAGRLIRWGVEKLLDDNEEADMVRMGNHIIKTLLAIPINLKGMPLFDPPSYIANHIKAFATLVQWYEENKTTATTFGISFDDQLKNGVLLNIKYGNLASKKGVRIRYHLATGHYEMPAQFMEMTHPAFNMEGKKENTYLAVGIDGTDSSIYGGIAVLPRGWMVRAAGKTAMQQLFDETLLIKLVFGEDYPVELFTKVIYQNAITGGMLQFNLAGYYKISDGQVLIGSIAIIDDIFAWDGSLRLQVKGLEDKEMQLERDRRAKLHGIIPDMQLNKTWNINNITASLHASYAAGILDIRGEAAYIPTDNKGRVKSAKATLIVTTIEKAWEEVGQQLPAMEDDGPVSLSTLSATGNELVVAGWGLIELSIVKNEDGSDLVSGKAGVVIDPDGHITVSGSITVEKMYTLMHPTGTDWEPVHPALEKSFGPYMIYIPGVPAGLYFKGHGGLYYKYMLGPLTLHDITIAGLYSTNPAINKELSVSARLNLSAELNGKVNIWAKAAVRVGTKIPYLGFNLSSVVVDVDGEAALKTYLDLAATFGVRQKTKPGTKDEKVPRTYIKGALQLAGELTLALKGLIDFSVAGGTVTDPKIDKQWPVANAGLTVDFDYDIGDKLTKEKLREIVKFRRSSFNNKNFVKGVLQNKTPKETNANKSKFTNEESKEVTEGSKDPIPIPEKTIPPTAIKDDFQMEGVWHYLELTAGEPGQPVTLKMASTPKELSEKIRAERDRTVMLLKTEKDDDRKKELQRKLDDLDELQKSAGTLINRTRDKGLDPKTYEVPGFHPLSRQIADFGKRYGIKDLGATAASTPSPGSATPNAALGDGSYEYPIPIRWAKRGYHSPITLTPYSPRWGKIPPPPEVTAAWDGKTKLELPPTQNKSFPGDAKSETRNGHTVKFIYIGIDPLYQAKQIRDNKKRLKRRKSPQKYSVSNKVRTLFENYNYSWKLGPTDADHALDQGLGGNDTLNNVWPIYDTMNRQYANEIYDQPVQYIENGEVKQSTPRELYGKMFIINSIGDPDKP